MPPKIVFNNTLPLPIVFKSFSQTHYLCHDCVRGLETRCCSGRTTLTYRLCAVHENVPENPLFDPSDLTHIREAILTNTLPQTIWQKDNNSNGTNHHNNGPAETSRQQRWPHPEIHYTHGDGCLYSSNPQCKILSADAIARQDVQCMSLYESLTAQAERLPSPPATLQAETTRLFEETRCCGRAAKAVFVKRCNGEWRNAFGYLYPSASSPAPPPSSPPEKISATPSTTTTTTTTSLHKTITHVKMEARTLEAREDMIRRGTVTFDHLVFMCWNMNKRQFEPEPVLADEGEGQGEKEQQLHLRSSKMKRGELTERRRSGSGFEV